MDEIKITHLDFPNNTPEHHLVEEVRTLHSMMFNSLVPAINKINTTLENYIKSTERLSRNTFYLNVVIAISAFIGAIKVGFDIFVHFSAK